VDRLPSKVSDGSKYLTKTGVIAIKNGIKQSSSRGRQGKALERKPEWLRIRLQTGPDLSRLKRLVHGHGLATVCEESHCPNLAECWSHGTATIMLMGSVCTRACRFCAVDTGNPRGFLDVSEPDKVARSVAAMNWRYIVLTSVDRDDLPDGGAGHFAKTIRAIKESSPQTAVEALTPDFGGDLEAVETVVTSGLKVFAQNLETVRRLTSKVRDPRAGYDQTLGILEYAKKFESILTKTSLLLGLGETDAEIEETMRDLRAVGCDIITLGQYLPPTLHHAPRTRWVTPEEFSHYRTLGLSLGFLEVASGPLVRSSYRADRILDGNNLGLTDKRTDSKHRPDLSPS